MLAVVLYNTIEKLRLIVWVAHVSLESSIPLPFKVMMQ